MTEREIRSLIFKLGVLILIGMVVQLVVIGYVFWSQYEGRKDNVANLRAGCRRGKGDRRDNAAAWRIAANARSIEGDFDVAERYSIIASNLERRASINCLEAYPKASVIR